MAKKPSIPKDWNNKYLREICKITSGGTPNRKNKEYWAQGKVPWITTALINFNLINSAEEFITDLGLENSSAKLFPKGTLLLAMYGQGVTRGKVAILEIEAATNQACAALLLKNGVHSKFLFFYLTNQYENLRNLSNSGGQKNLSAGLLKSFKLILPPIPEQKKIASILTTWDKALQTIDQLLAKKRCLKKGLMQGLLTGEVRFPEFARKKIMKKSKLGWIPKDWKEIKFQEIRDRNIKWSLTGGPFGSDLKTEHYIDDNNGIRVIQLQNLGDGFFIEKGLVFTSIKKADELLSCNIYPNEIILSKMGDPVARACMIPKNKDNRYLIGSDGIRLVPDKEKFDFYFVKEYINFYVFRQLAIRYSTGSTRQRIGLQDLKKLPFIAPSLEEQKKIAEVLKACDKEIQQLEKERDTLRLQKKGLMQILLTGEKRVNVEGTIA